jgi:hypothetical protein
MAGDALGSTAIAASIASPIPATETAHRARKAPHLSLLVMEDLILTHTEESRQAARVFGPTLLVGLLFSWCWAKLTGRL